MMSALSRKTYAVALSIALSGCAGVNLGSVLLPCDPFAGAAPGVEENARQRMLEEKISENDLVAAEKAVAGGRMVQSCVDWAKRHPSSLLYSRLESRPSDDAYRDLHRYMGSDRGLAYLTPEFMLRQYSGLNGVTTPVGEPTAYGTINDPANAECPFWDASQAREWVGFLFSRSAIDGMGLKRNLPANENDVLLKCVLRVATEAVGSSTVASCLAHPAQ